MKNYHGSHGSKINSTRIPKNALVRRAKLHESRPQKVKDTNTDKEDKA